MLPLQALSFDQQFLIQGFLFTSIRALSLALWKFNNWRYYLKRWRLQHLCIASYVSVSHYPFAPSCFSMCKKQHRHVYSKKFILCISLQSCLTNNFYFYIFWHSKTLVLFVVLIRIPFPVYLMYLSLIFLFAPLRFIDRWINLIKYGC